jgi:hypothetical protein
MSSQTGKGKGQEKFQFSNWQGLPVGIQEKKNRDIISEDEML